MHPNMVIISVGAPERSCSMPCHQGRANHKHQYLKFLPCCIVQVAWSYNPAGLYSVPLSSLAGPDTGEGRCCRSGLGSHSSRSTEFHNLPQIPFPAAKGGMFPRVLWQASERLCREEAPAETVGPVMSQVRSCSGNDRAVAIQAASFRI